VNTTKVCSKCKTEANLSFFYKDRNNKDDLSSWCKACVRLANKLNARVRGKKTNPSRSSISRRYRQKNTDKYKAHWKVQAALRSGVLVRPDNCEKCGLKCKPHGHHDNYASPLAVRWLCIDCHAHYHNSLKDEYSHA